MFIGRTNAEAPILWPPDVRSRLIRKDPAVGKDWKQGEKRAIEDWEVGWHHWLNEGEFEWAPGDSEGQEACCAAVLGVTESYTTKQLNSNNNISSGDGQEAFLLSQPPGFGRFKDSCYYLPVYIVGKLLGEKFYLQTDLKRFQDPNFDGATSYLVKDEGRISFWCLNN